jgi:hypothetical protein
MFIFAYLKLSEQGILNWNSFSEKPTRALKEIFIEPRFIVYKYNSSFSLGLRFFSLNTFNYKGKELELDSEYSSIGPTTIIQSRILKKILISLSGYYEFIKLSNSADKQQATMNFSISWNF